MIKREVDKAGWSSGWCSPLHIITIQNRIAVFCYRTRSARIWSSPFSNGRAVNPVLLWLGRTADPGPRQCLQQRYAAHRKGSTCWTPERTTDSVSDLAAPHRARVHVLPPRAQSGAPASAGPHLVLPGVESSYYCRRIKAFSVSPSRPFYFACADDVILRSSFHVSLGIDYCVFDHRQSRKFVT
jgi:hypothetical protein